MNKPMIENSDRGITLNKSLAWTMATGLILVGLWVGIQVTELKSAVQELGVRQSEDRSEIRANAAAIVQIQRTEARVDQRLLTIEQSVARTEATTNEILRYLRGISQETPQ
jgi:hypothetical protein